MVYSTRRFVLSLALCYFVLVFFSHFSIATTSLGEEKDNLSAFRTFVRFALVWFCLFPLPLSVWDGLRLVIVAFSGLFCYHFSFMTFVLSYFVPHLAFVRMCFVIRNISCVSSCVFLTHILYYVDRDMPTGILGYIKKQL